VIIYELPDSMEILYQMIGRASREGTSGTIFIFHDRNVLSRHRIHLQKSLREGTISSEMAELLNASLLAMQNLKKTFVANGVRFCSISSVCQLKSSLVITAITANQKHTLWI